MKNMNFVIEQNPRSIRVIAEYSDYRLEILDLIKLQDEWKITPYPHNIYSMPVFAEEKFIQFLEQQEPEIQSIICRFLV